jgi:hypothetical protein
MWTDIASGRCSGIGIQSQPRDQNGEPVGEDRKVSGTQVEQMAQGFVMMAEAGTDLRLAINASAELPARRSTSLMRSLDSGGASRSVDAPDHLVPLPFGSFHHLARTALDTVALSAENFLACPTTRLVVSSSWPYAVSSFSRPFSLLSRLTRVISRMRCLTLRVRPRSLAPASLAAALTFVITRVSTRTPSLSSVLSVGR